MDLIINDYELIASVFNYHVFDCSVSGITLWCRYKSYLLHHLVLNKV